MHDGSGQHLCDGSLMIILATAASLNFHPCVLVSKLNSVNNFPDSDFINSRSNGCACQKIEGFVPRNHKDNDGLDHDFLEQDNSGSYNIVAQSVWK